MWRGYLLLLARAFAAVLPTHGYEVDVTLTRRPTLVSYLQASSAGLDEAQCRARLDDLKATPYAFLKGTPGLFYADMDDQDELGDKEWASSDAYTWIVGDALFERLGVYENDQGQGVFDFVDTDAAWVASYLHDVYRMSTALGVLASGELGGSNLPRYEAAVTLVYAYIEQLRLLDSQPDLKDVNAAQSTDGGFAKTTLENVLSDRAELLSTWANGTSAASSDEEIAVTAAVQRYASDAAPEALRGNTPYFAVKSVVKMRGAYELQTSFRVLVEGASEDATDDEVLWVKPQQPLPPVWENVASAQQRQFEGTALADSAARVAAAHAAMLINTADGMAATVLAGEPATVQFVSPRSTSVTFEAIREHITEGDNDAVMSLAADMGTLLGGLHARSSVRGEIARAGGATFEQVVLGMVSNDTLKNQFAIDVAGFAVQYVSQVVGDSSYLKRNTAPVANEVCVPPVWELRTGTGRLGTIASAVMPRTDNPGAFWTASWPLCNERASALAVSTRDFFSSAAALFYADASDIVRGSGLYDADLTTWIHGNAHVGSVRVARVLESGPPARQVGLGLTDFSHAWVESYLFDVYRFAVSVALLAAEVGAPARTMVQEFMMAYLTATATNQTDAATLEVTEATASSFVATRLRQARSYLTRANMLVLLTNLTLPQLNSGAAAGEFVLSETASPLGAVASVEGPALAQALANYAERTATDLNITAVGRGTGTMAAVTYYALVEGSSPDMRDDRLLEVRRVTEPAIYPYLSAAARARVESMVPGGQPTMPYILSEAALVMRQEGAPRVGYTSSFCGTNSPARADGSTIPLQQFVVREVGPVEMQRHPDVDDVDEATALVSDAAKVLAIAHLRGNTTFGDKLSNFLPPARTAPHLALIMEVVDFATAYALQVEEDYQAFQTMHARGNRDWCGELPSCDAEGMSDLPVTCAVNPTIQACSSIPAGSGTDGNETMPTGDDRSQPMIVSVSNDTTALRRSWGAVAAAVAVAGWLGAF